MCPKCAYARSARDSNPAWQCPGCGIAYAKYKPRAGLIAETREMAAEAASDFSVAVLVAANLLVLGIAWRTGMSLRSLMFVYWMQSVIIGVSMIVRIMRLERFATDGFTMNGKRLPEDPGAKAQVAFFFLIHFGGFHLVYCIFLVATPVRGAGLEWNLGYVLCALVFALNHAYSLRHNLRRDARGRPNLGTLMMLPYARILPMHAAILSGALMSGAGAFSFVLFGILKTVADVIMHTVEHHVLGKEK
jgi:hypothetical protein